MRPLHRLGTIALVAALATVGLAAPAVADDRVAVSGTISLGDAAHPAGAGEARVRLEYFSTNGGGWTDDFTPVDAQGHYSVSIPRPAAPGIRVVLHAEYLGAGAYRSVWGNRTAYAADVAEADDIPYSAGGTTFDQVLPLPVTITGTALDSAGGPATGYLSARGVRTDVSRYASPTLDETDFVTLAADGSYRIPDVLPGRYRIVVGGTKALRLGSGPTGIVDWPVASHSVDIVATDAVTVVPPITTVLAVQISGTLTCAPCTAVGGSPPIVEQTLLSVAPDGSTTIAGTRTGDVSLPAGTTSFSFIAYPGTYRVHLGVLAHPEWGAADSEPITLTEGGSTSATLATTTIPSVRIGAADRAATSVALSRNTLEPDSAYSPGLDTVYIANGWNFPDALAAAPVAALAGAPLLLVTPSDIPGSVADELRRLRPRTIVVVGGSASVSTDVERRLGEIVGSSTAVRRVAGQDRYATARAIAAAGFPDGADTILIATGRGFADALSAGAAAAVKKAPVLVVDGTADSADAATLALIRSLGVKHAEIVGGPMSVSTSYEQSLSGIAGLAVTRQWGGDRYETSVSVNSEAFPDLMRLGRGDDFTARAHVFLASGENFPDALAGVALAGRLAEPLYISPQSCIPQGVGAQLIGHAAGSAVLLGGPSALSEAVARFTTC